MSNLVELATDDEQVVGHADWAELQCLLKEDRSISREDLARALNLRGFTSEENSRELADQAFDELNDRAKTLSTVGARVYPYRLDERIEVLKYLPIGKGSVIGRLPYMFLLVVSRHSMSSKDRKRANIDPTVVFEQACAQVLQLFLGGDKQCFTHHIGTGGASKPTNFPTSIGKLCKRLSEGGTWKTSAQSPGAGDGGVDIVAWRRFQDRRPGNLVGFAQCKTGINWRKELGKLRPAGFCGKFMTEPLILEPRSFFMVPHRIRRSVWEDRMRDGGALLFDRCRIVEYAIKLDAETRGRAEKWLRAALATIGADL